MSGRRVISQLALATAALLLAVCGGGSSLDGNLRNADAAAATGDWTGAFAGYVAAVEIDPDHGGARAGLRTAAHHLVGMVPGLSVDVEVALLRYLEEHGDLNELATVLDRSMVEIDAGWFLMGNSAGRLDERPERQVYLDGFRIDRYEVTNLQYASFVAAEHIPQPPYWADGAFPDRAATHPVVGVSWRQADQYCSWAGKRLPTEAEWERSCRGSSGLEYPWGDDWEPSRVHVAMLPLEDPDTAWALLTDPSSAPASPEQAGEPAAGASVEGVCNLAGNASEWIADWYDATAYTRLTAVNPIGDEPPWNHAVRGGSWLFRFADLDLMVDQSSCSFRNASHSAGDPRVGFRCAAGDE